MKVNSCKNCNIEFTSARRRGTCSARCRSQLKYKTAKAEGKRWVLNLKLRNSRKNTTAKKQELISLKGGCCQKCGYMKSIKALDFHHFDKKKEQTISKLLFYKRETILKELHNCMILCSNCHRQEHSFLIKSGQDYQHKLRRFLQEKAGARCSNCLISDPNVLDFHHINPNEKTFSISSAIASRWHVEKVAPEVNKCTLLCSNCHREHHDGLTVKINPINITPEDINSFVEINGRIKSCAQCRIQYKTTAITKFCSSRCRNVFLFKKNLKKIIWELKSELKTKKIKETKVGNKSKPKDQKNQKVTIFLTAEQIKNAYISNDYNLTKAGKILNISNTAVKKRLKEAFPSEWVGWSKIKGERKMIACLCCNKKIFKYSKTYFKNRYCSAECRNKRVIRYKYDSQKIIECYEKNKRNILKTAKELKIGRKSLSRWLIKNNLHQEIKS